jgi:hypothetical protein
MAKPPAALTENVIMITKQLVPIAAAAWLAAGCDKPNRQSVEVKSPAEVEARHKVAPEHANAEFKDQMTEKVFQDYLRVRTALVRSDPDEASDAAEDIADSFGSDHSTLNQLAKSLAESDNLARQREIFSRLSAELRPLLEKGISAGNIHILHCPMAFDDKGAEWISDSKEILNPYFGDKMLRCGEVRETITPTEP